MHLRGEAGHLWVVNRQRRWHSAGQWREHDIGQHENNRGDHGCGEWRWLDGRGARLVLRSLIVAAARSSEGNRTGPGEILQGKSLNHGGGGH